MIRCKKLKMALTKSHSNMQASPTFIVALFVVVIVDYAITPEKHKGFVYYHCTQYNGKHGAKWLREEAITEQIGTSI